MTHVAPHVRRSFAVKSPPANSRTMRRHSCLRMEGALSGGRPRGAPPGVSSPRSNPWFEGGGGCRGGSTHRRSAAPPPHTSTQLIVPAGRRRYATAGGTGTGVARVHRDPSLGGGPSASGAIHTLVHEGGTASALHPRGAHRAGDGADLVGAQAWMTQCKIAGEDRRRGAQHPQWRRVYEQSPYRRCRQCRLAQE